SKIMEPNRDNLKRRAARRAVEFIQDGQVIGIGTGSTTFFAIQALGERVSDGLRVRGVPTSVQSEKVAENFGIPIVSLNDVDAIDVAIDGADEVDAHFDLIKGGGGALTREKLVMIAARERVIIIDEQKLVSRLGESFKLPVEVLPFAWRHSERFLQELG